MSPKEESWSKERNSGRRNTDHKAFQALMEVGPIWRNKWARLGALVIVTFGGAVAERAIGITEVLPGGSWRRAVDDYIRERQVERERMLPQFEAVQKEVAALRQEVATNKSIGEAERAAINSRLQRIEDKLDRWFEGAKR